MSAVIQRTPCVRWFDSPLGRIAIVVADSQLVGLYFEGQKYFPVDLCNETTANEQDQLDASSESLMDDVCLQLREYFDGQREAFSVPLKLIGTEFQRQVWRELETIPFGELRTYGEIAAAIGKPDSARAVGAAIGKNPISIVVPCHRVIGQNKSLVGYAGGLDRKKHLLELESNLPTLVLAQSK